MTHTVHTQTLENYGAHSGTGRFQDDENYWKFKGGSTYLVKGLGRLQDAVAFIASIITHNYIMFKEFVSDFGEGDVVDKEYPYVELDAEKFMKADQKTRNKMLSNFVYPEDYPVCA